MMTQWIRKHPYAAFFIMVFGWTWSIVVGLILAGTDVNQPTPQFIIGGMLCNISPSIAAFIITGITKGKEGTRSLKARFKMKHSVGLLMLTLFTVLIVNLITKGIAQFTIRTYTFELTVPLLIMGITWPFVSSFGEEFGWRGFILPAFLKKFRPLAAGVLLGTIWEIWHLPMHYMEFRTYGEYMLPAFVVIGFLNLILQSVIMTNIFVRSKGNMKLMVLYHATITGSAIIIEGFLKTVKTPRAVVLEGVVSVVLFSMVAVVLYARLWKEMLSKEYLG